jgi:hypothetical protein
MKASLRLWFVVILFSFTMSINAQTEPTELRIMTFNIWLGGELVNVGKVVESIQSADADIVGLQEATGNTRSLAEALGWYANERMQIISRFLLIDPPGGGGNYLFAQIAPGDVVAVANVHLPSDPYGPYLVRDGSTLGEVLENEQATRMPMLEPLHSRTLISNIYRKEQGLAVAVIHAVIVSNSVSSAVYVYRKTLEFVHHITTRRF